MNPLNPHLENPAETLQELANIHNKPVVLCDHYITRRQRVHCIIYPQDRDTYVSGQLLDCLIVAFLEPVDSLILAGLGSDKRLKTMYIDRHQDPAKVTPNG